MNIWQRILNFFRRNALRNQSIVRTVKNLQIRDIVSYDFQDFEVVGKIVYTDSGYDWTTYQLKGEDRSIWLSYEEGDEVEIGIYETTKAKLDNPNSKRVTVDGIEFVLDEKGVAKIKDKEGRAGVVVGDELQYWSFESEDEEYEYLSVENWGGEIEISKGYGIEERELTIIAAR